MAGVLVDRCYRKLMMMLSDLGAVTATLGILTLHATGHLQFWHLYVAAVLNGLGNTFQWPAYSATISTMLPKEHYGRANGMMSLVESGLVVFAPLLAGALLPLIGLTGILTLDVATFFLAISALLVVQIPQPRVSLEGQKGRGSLWKEVVYGFMYIFARPGLGGLVSRFLVANLFSGMAWTVFASLVLSRTGNNSMIFGSIQTAAAIGGVAGGILIRAWGGFKRRIHGILGVWLVSNLFGMVAFGLGQGPGVWIPSIVLVTLLGPVVVGSSQAIWQAKVAPDVQGCGFVARRLIAWFTQPISPILAGTLADFVLEPAMQNEMSGLARTFGSTALSDEK
jgi:DHA3 family macrolide efflux protein-like MFS transporter